MIYMIYDYKRAKEGEVGIIYWKVTGAKSTANSVSGSGYTIHNPYALPALPLPCWLFLFAWSRAAAQKVPLELLQFRYWLAAHGLVGEFGKAT